MALSFWTRMIAVSACCWLLPATFAAAQQAGGRTPMLIEGKKTLFQRVLTRPGARISAQPGAAGANTLPPLTALYVYGRQQAGSDNWLEVGSDSAGKIVGFLREADTVPWRHTLTLAFTNPANRDPVLFTKDRDSTVQLLENSSQIPQLAILANENKLPKDSPIISVEPRTFVDLHKQFYLLPILEANTAVLNSGFKVRTVRVASVTKNPDAPPAGGESQRVNLDQAMAQFRSAVVFVVDATASMQPYIDRTRQAMDTVFKEVESNKLNDRVRFGMIAFRDDPAKTPGMEYLAKTFADPNKTPDRKTFFDSVAGVAASKQSTRAFAEDGFAGLEQAIRKIDWSGFGGRYVVLITDASMREGQSPLASTGMSTEQMRQLARENRIAIYALHLQTQEGKADHSKAKAQYERLTNFENVGALYFPVEAGDAAKFHSQVQHLAELLVAQVKTSQGAPSAGQASGGDKMAKTTEEVGLAMRLAYLGQVQGAAVPPLFEAWAADRDPRKPDIASFSVRVLLTKNQLSDLQATLRRVVEAGEKGQIDPSNFFNQLRSAAAAMGRDPSKVGSNQARNLEDLGLMGEYLDGLPYQSKLMALDQDSWARMSVGQQQALIDEIKSKVALYQRYHDDVDRWVQLASGGSAGDAVYPVPLDSLP